MTVRLLEIERSVDGGVKYLWGMPDPTHSVESVFFRLNGAPCVCISTQIGCVVNCAFCETGRQKPLGNLSATAIAAQVELARDDLTERGELPEGRFRTAIIAGMGEPLLNAEAVDRAAHLILDGGLAERVTLTTSGILPAFATIARTPLSLLSVSLHATTDEVRDQLVPINRKYPIAALLEASAHYRRSTGIPVMMNYLMFDGVNDSDDDLRRLVSLLDPSLFQVKLKQWNTVGGTMLAPSSEERFHAFKRHLDAAGFETVIDYSRNVDVAGGCGQLRSRVREFRQGRDQRQEAERCSA